MISTDYSDYSEKEKKLFRYFKMPELLIEGEHATPAPTLYRMAAEKAFLDNAKGPYVESLRRCVRALNNSKIYRLTPEWESMIQFSEPDGSTRGYVGCADHIPDMDRQYYIYRNSKPMMYMHRDGQWYNRCGDPNFFYSYEEARTFLDLHS